MEELFFSEKKVIDFLSSIKNQSENTTVLHRAVVCDIDRIGGQFDDNYQGNPSPIFSIKARVITKTIDNTGSTTGSNSHLSTFYPLSDVTDISLPVRGEVVWVLYDSTNTRLKRGYWLNKITPPMSNSVLHPFRYNEAGEEFGDAPEEARFGGARPASIDMEYDIPPDPLYEPFPSIIRIKPGDKIQIGRSNTRIQHSFNTESKGDRRGYIELVTETQYIKPEENVTTTSGGITNQYHTDNFLDPTDQKWQFLNSEGTRVVLSTKINIDNIFISHESAKDGTGELSNVQLNFDKQFIESKSNGESNIGSEILEQPIQDDVNYSNTADDVTHAESNARGTIIFDQNVASYLIESDCIRIISRSGDELNHMVLGERLCRLLIRSELDKLYIIRILDQLRDRVNKLSNDFLVHQHALLPSSTIQPLGSTMPPGPIKYELDHFNNTSGDVGNDSGDLTENGSDIPEKDGDLKDRIQEIRKEIETRIKEISSILSRNIAIN